MKQMTPPTRLEYTEEYKQGYRAYEEGLSKKANPYLSGTSSHTKWLAGYIDAKDDPEQEENR